MCFAPVTLDSVVTLFLCLTESLSRFEDKASRERTSLENKVKTMEEALEKAREEAKSAKDEAKKLKKRIETFEKDAKAKVHSRKVEEGFKGLVNKISGNISP